MNTGIRNYNLVLNNLKYLLIALEDFDVFIIIIVMMFLAMLLTALHLNFF